MPDQDPQVSVGKIPEAQEELLKFPGDVLNLGGAEQGENDVSREGLQDKVSVRQKCVGGDSVNGKPCLCNEMSATSIECNTWSSHQTEKGAAAIERTRCVDNCCTPLADRCVDAPDEHRALDGQQQGQGKGPDVVDVVKDEECRFHC